MRALVIGVVLLTATVALGKEHGAMGSEARPSLKIYGSGSAAGGVYKTVTIAGSGTVRGDVEAEKVTIMGSGEIHGRVDAERISIEGSGEINGDVVAKDVVIAGSGEIAGGIRASRVSISGSARIQNNVRTTSFSGSGSFKVGGDVEADDYVSSGGFTIKGLLNADSIEIGPAGTCTVREIGGEKIAVVEQEAGCGVWPFRYFRAAGTLKAESIEGDDVYLEVTQADVVRGRRVRIAGSCRVGSVEYSESLEIDPEATVGRYTYTGQGPAREPVFTAPVGPLSRRTRSLPMTGYHIRHWLLRVPMAILGVAVAIICIALVLLLLIPLARIAIAILVFGGVLALVALILGLPVFAGCAAVVGIFMLPFVLLRRLFGFRRPPRHRTW